MSRPDWRDPADYESLRNVDTPTLKGEFLKRNPDYIADHERLGRLAAAGRLEAADRDAFAAAWGLRFRGERQPPGLDGAGSPYCRWRGIDTFGVGWATAPR